jgi:hypothetical protein
VVLDVLGSWSFLANPENHLYDLATRSLNGTILGHIETDLGFGGLGIVLLEDDCLVRDSADFSGPQGIGQPYRSPSYDCYFPSSYVFLQRLMAFGSFFKLVF